MSQEELINRYKSAIAKRDLTTEDGLKAAAIISAQAEKEGVECARAMKTERESSTYVTN